jgi:DNA-directed RNA polymerase specialized sigma24 family protein
LLRLIKPFMHGCSVLITSNKSGASKWHYENDSISFEDTFYARVEKEEQRRLLDKGLSLATAKTRSIVLLKASGLNDIDIARALKVRVKSCSNKFWMFVRRFKLMFVRTAI